MKTGKDTGLVHHSKHILAEFKEASDRLRLNPSTSSIHSWH